MNKYLMMSAAALIASSASAAADDGGKSHFNGIVSFGTCDYLVLHYGVSNFYVVNHVYSACGGSLVNVLDLGFASKGGNVPGNSKGKGILSIGDTTFAYNYHENYAAMMQLSTPIQNQGKWDLWVAFSPSSAFLANDGVYNVPSGALHGAAGTTTEKVAGIIRQRDVAPKPTK